MMTGGGLVEGPARRRWGPWVAVGLLLLLLVVGVVLHSPWLSVHEIEIVGADRVDATGRLEGAGIGPGAIMIWLDTTAVEEAILADPWVVGVAVERVFPNRLVVEVDERRPIAWVEGLVTWMLVGDDGAVVEVASQPGDGILTVAVPFSDVPAGAHPDDPVWDEFVALGSVLEPQLAGQSRLVRQLSEFWLEIPGHRVRLGHPIDLGEKGLVLQSLLANGIETGSVVDLVAPRRPAVTPPPPALIEGDVTGSVPRG
jgi:cell division protein FtsQ